jgi:hypothetical protein
MARDSDTIELIVDGQPQEVKIFLDKTGPQGPKGETGPAGPAGATGNGIQSITKTGSSGLVDTYTILFTDGTSTTFTVTNGQDGSADIHWGDVQGSIADQADLQAALNDKQGKLTAGTNITIDANNVISAAGGSGGGAVDSVNGKTGVVVLDADDVGALPDTTTASDLGAYVKPSSGIPKTDLASAVQSSLNKADTALQTAPVTSVNTKTGAVSLTASDLGAYTKPSTGIPKSDLASSVQTSLGKADTALQSAPVTSVNSKTGAVSLSASDVGALPDSTTIPAKTSDLTNDSGFLTSTGAVTSFNGQHGAVTYTAPVTSVNGQTGAVTVSVPVASVDGKTGAVTVLPTGGTTGQVLAKASNTDRDVEWVNQSGGGGGSDLYELVNTYTVTDTDVSFIYWNQDSDGNALDLNALAVFFVPDAEMFPAGGSSQNIFLRVDDGSVGPNGAQYEYDLRANISGAKNFLARIELFAEGAWLVESWTMSGRTSSLTAFPFAGLKLSNETKIGEVKLMIPTANVYFNTGGIFYLYGRRN